MKKKIKIVSIITGLANGGTEKMLLKLLEKVDRKRFDFIIISLTSKGDIGERIEKLGYRVYPIFMGKFPNPKKFWQLVTLLKELKPNLVHTRLNHANLVGGIAAKIANIDKVCWGVHQSNISFRHNKLFTILTIKVCALLSKRIPSCILANSKEARDVHIGIGFSKSKFYVIPNGFDLSRFKPNHNSKGSLLEELHLPQNTKLIGLIGRYDSQKNHKGFFDMAAEVAKKFENVHFVLAGDKVDSHNIKLKKLIKNIGLETKVHLLGFRDDVPKIMASLDVLVSSSVGEAFPNVLGEAMSSEVPCVATNVGDCKEIIGQTGYVVCVGDMKTLSLRVIDLLHLNIKQRRKLGKAARNRILEKFELDKIVSRYEGLYMKLSEGLR